MIDRNADPRTEDTLVYELLSTARGASSPEVIGRATFRAGASTVEAPEAVQVAVDELLARAFVDRIQADERPRGYRRSGSGMVDMLVPGMAEHFMARLRGLWLSYPDGSVVTARASAAAPQPTSAAGSGEAGSPVTDPRVRRSTLVTADRLIGARPLVVSHAPEDGSRPDAELSQGPLSRTDCGWIV